MLDSKIKKSNTPDISVIILTWNSEIYIENCVTSFLRDCNRLYSCEVFIVDNGSSDKTRDCIGRLKREYGRTIKPIFLEKNYGTTYPRNIALKQAKGDFIAIVDSDVEVGKSTIRRLIEVLNSNKNVGIVAPKLVYPSGHLQKSTDDFPTIFTKVFRYFFLKLIEKREKEKSPSGLTQVDYAISAMWMLKRELLKVVGLLDENITYAPEDVDYCLRVWKSGYEVLYIPDVTCVHHTQEISRGLSINRATIEHFRGLVYYFWKHKYLIRKPSCNPSRS